MSEKKYNGWTNYETWLLNLHLTNDQETYSLIKDMNRDELYTFVRKRLHLLECDEDLLMQDIFLSFMSSVNFYEIIDGLKEG